MDEREFKFENPFGKALGLENEFSEYEIKTARKVMDILDLVFKIAGEKSRFYKMAHEQKRPNSWEIQELPDSEMNTRNIAETMVDFTFATNLMIMENLLKSAVMCFYGFYKTDDVKVTIEKGGFTVGRA